ncbi:MULTISPECIES: bifunctional serine/threonine-protein kinase/formylglycine-generating enzyme family protein [unclassified Microcoleus]|uniref:bifunctional serine/threonine-protein kinase/formylglycine-generating enzyme family protein n=1 Tax=unclassified Microcoleus TaxID=2642155 RepID=UPI0025ED2B9A|nr:MULTISPECIES: bifunctional serine/threonine-protein kinase/formylglycine-generating enzyme family protein [unclassified Microcoleus]
MFYCSNPRCSNPFNPDKSKFCQSCGQADLTPLFRNRYRVIRLLGEGGFGRTYEAVDIDRMDDPCVIKQFMPQVQGTSALEKATELFKQEAKRLYELGEHPQIPRLIAYFEQDKRLYLVQELIEGQNLLAELTQQGVFSEEKIWQLLADILPILKFVHDRNVIHRDIKLENIIRRRTSPNPSLNAANFSNSAFRRGARRELVLIDFGVSKQVTGSLMSQVGTTVGTPGYSPVEQMRGQVFPGSDLYSLGITCLRLLTQCLPKADGSDDLYDPINGGWIWRERLPAGTKISSELTTILDKLIQDYLKNRYQSADEVIKALNLYSLPPQPHFVKAGQLALNSSQTKAALPPLNAYLTEGGKLAINTPLNHSPQVNSNISVNSRVKSHTNPPHNQGTPKISAVKSSFEFQVVTVDNRGQKTDVKSGKTHFFEEHLGRSTVMEMVSVPGGTFLMGTPKDRGDSDEKPQHSVTLAPFYIGKFPVTQAQWAAVAALPEIKIYLNPDAARFKGVNRPIENISWYEAMEFCARLSRKTGKHYRLPSEAQWEYACRGETSGPFHFGETITSELANYNGNSNYADAPKGVYRFQTTDVGSFKPNAFGLYDLHGNVWEWCADAWHNNYNGAPVDGSVWESGGDFSLRLLRGGSWNDHPPNCRSACRLRYQPDCKASIVGFRVVVPVV